MKRNFCISCAGEIQNYEPKIQEGLFTVIFYNVYRFLNGHTRKRIFKLYRHIIIKNKVKLKINIFLTIEISYQKQEKC